MRAPSVRNSFCETLEPCVTTATVFTVSHVVMRGEDRIVLGIADTFGKQNCNSKQNMFLKIMHFQENDIFSSTESVADGDIEF